MNTLKARSMDSRSGQVMVVFALALVPVLVIMLALTADVGHIFTMKANLQNGADAAALAAARVLIEARLDQGLDEAGARAVAAAEGLQLKDDNCPGSDLALEFGIVNDAGDFVAVDGATEATAVRATVSRDGSCEAGAVDLFFSGIMGRQETDVESMAVASLFANLQEVGGLVPFAVRDTEVGALGSEMVFYPWDPITGNFGLVNMDGESGGGAAELKAAIEDGARLKLVGDGNWVDGETGITASIEKPMKDLIGKPLVILIWDVNSYESDGDTGTAVKYHVTGFLAATLTKVSLTGASGKSELRVRVEGIMTPEELGVDGYLGPGGNPSPNVRKVALWQ